MSRILSILMLIMLVPLQSCANGNSGYRFGSTFDESIKTIAVPIFSNNTLQRGLEVQLTESLSKQIRSQTPWTLVKSSQADTTLAGVITSHRLTQISQAPRTGLVQEQAVRVTVNFEWRDNRSGDIIVARNNFSATATFAPQRGVSQRIEDAERQAIQELAEDLVAQLRTNW